MDIYLRNEHASATRNRQARVHFSSEPWFKLYSSIQFFAVSETYRGEMAESFEDLLDLTGGSGWWQLRVCIYAKNTHL